MSIPGVSGTVADGGLGAGGSLGTDTIIVVGPATVGPLGSNGGVNGGPGFTPHTSTSAVLSTYTSGPMVELACYLLNVPNNPPTVICYRTPSSSPGALGTLITSAWTGTTVPSWTGTPLDSSEQFTTVVAGGVVGTAGITLNESWDNGRTTEPGPVPLGTLSTYSPPGSGLVLHLDPPSAALYASLNNLRTALLAHFIDVTASTHALSDTIDNGALTAIPAATTYPTAITLFNACVTFLSAHVSNASGAHVYHTNPDTVAETALALITTAVYAIDVVLQLPPLIALYNAHRILTSLPGPLVVHGAADTTNTCAASTATGGTVVAGDTLYQPAVEPMPSAADVATAISTITAGLRRSRCMVVTGTIGVSEFTTLDTDSLAFETEHDWSFLLMNTRDYNAGETDPQYVTSLGNTWGLTFAANKRISLFAGFGKHVGSLGAPNAGRQIRRPAAWAVARRFMEYDPAVNVAEVERGPLADFSISDANGNPTEHDERVNGGLGGFTDPARIGTLCTFKGKSGCYVCIPWMKVAAGSDYIRIHLRAVMDLACAQTYDDLLILLNKGVPVDPTTGFLDPAKANTIAFKTNSDLRGILLQRVGSLQRPRASGGAYNRGKGFVNVHTTDNLLVPGTPLYVDIGFVPLAYLEAIAFTISLVNPAVLAQ